MHFSRYYKNVQFILITSKHHANRKLHLFLLTTYVVCTLTNVVLSKEAMCFFEKFVFQKIKQCVSYHLFSPWCHTSSSLEKKTHATPTITQNSSASLTSNPIHISHHPIISLLLTRWKTSGIFWKSTSQSPTWISSTPSKNQAATISSRGFYNTIPEKPCDACFLVLFAQPNGFFRLWWCGRRWQIQSHEFYHTTMTRHFLSDFCKENN